jgi:hypothetical protein
MQRDNQIRQADAQHLETRAIGSRAHICSRSTSQGSGYERIVLRTTAGSVASCQRVHTHKGAGAGGVQRACLIRE